LTDMVPSEALLGNSRTHCMNLTTARTCATACASLTHQWTGFGVNNSQSGPEAGWLAMAGLICLQAGAWSPLHRRCQLAWLDPGLQLRSLSATRPRPAFR
jgi:hypothetical protein